MGKYPVKRKYFAKTFSIELTRKSRQIFPFGSYIQFIYSVGLWTSNKLLFFFNLEKTALNCWNKKDNFRPSCQRWIVVVHASLLCPSLTSLTMSVMIMWRRNSRTHVLSSSTSRRCQSKAGKVLKIRFYR